MLVLGAGTGVGVPNVYRAMTYVKGTASGSDGGGVRWAGLLP